MTGMGVAISPIDPLKGSERQYAALNRFNNRIQAERWPDDPPLPVEYTIRSLQSIPAFVAVSIWLAWQSDGSEVIGRARLECMVSGDNLHAAFVDISVVPEARRQGVGRRLLVPVVEAAIRNERRLLFAETLERVSAGAAFMNRLGARSGLAEHFNQLELSELNHDLVRLWQERARERASDFELGIWTGLYPEEHLDAIARLHESMNLAPRGVLEMEDMRFTPERVRQMEGSQRRRGFERWSAFVRERRTGEFAGFTEVLWHPDRPEVVHQEATSVHPQYRNKGLGRWLKAAMLDKVLRDRPQVKRVRTGNADSNAAMLKINYELGFKPYQAVVQWQVETGKVRAYLQASAHLPQT